MPLQCDDPTVEQVTEVTLEGSVDQHFHARNPAADGDGRMELVIESAVGEHEVLVLIGNPRPVVLTQGDGDAHLEKATGALPEGAETELYVAPLLTDKTTPEMVREMRVREPRNVLFLKAFLAGVSNDGGHSVSDVRALAPTLRACHDDSVDAPPLPCDWHMERKYKRNGERIQMCDREWEAMITDFREVLEIDPLGSHCVKHLSDGRTIELLVQWRKDGYDVWGEIASHYLVRCHEDLYEGRGGGTEFNANELCWPIYKSAWSQQKLRSTVLRDLPWLCFGSDCAWHIDDPTQERGVKITDDGRVCGGTAILPALSKAIIIDLCVRNGRAAMLDNIFSRNARRRLGLGPAKTRVTYRRDDSWQIPEFFWGENSNGPFRVRPFMCCEKPGWKRAA